MSRSCVANRLAAQSLLAMLIGVSIATAGTARGAEPLEYQARRASGPVRIDGRLTEPAWQAAERIERFQFPWFAEGQREQTTARIVWDEAFLYLAFECDDAYLWAEHQDRDSPVYRDDCVELFTAPNIARPETYFNFEMNVRAALLDQWHPSGRYSGSERPWDSRGVSIAVRWRGTLNDDSDLDLGWTLEAAIPWSNFAVARVALPPRPGDTWRMNLNRCGGASNVQYSQWTSSGTERPDFHVPAAFGTLRFVNGALASWTGEGKDQASCPSSPCRRWLRHRVRGRD